MSFPQVSGQPPYEMCPTAADVGQCVFGLSPFAISHLPPSPLVPLVLQLTFPSQRMIEYTRRRNK